MTKHKNLYGYNLSMATKDNLTMATKDGLTREEAREAIGILALRKGNVENVAMSGQLIVYTLLAAFTTIFVSGVTILFSNSNSPLVSTISLIFLVSFMLLFMAFLINRLVGNYDESKSKSIKETMEKLAKEHNLGDFYKAVLGKYK